MSPTALIQFLQSTQLVRQARAEEIASYFRPYTLQKGEFLLKAGNVDNTYLFLESGFLRSFAHDAEGNDVTTGFFKSGQVVFEVSSFFTRTPSQENIQALADCNGWSISFEGLNGLFHGMPEFREFGRNLLVRGYTALKNRMLSQITDTAEIRYEKLLQSNPEIFQYAALKHIASYLGITDTSLSRIRKELAKK